MLTGVRTHIILDSSPDSFALRSLQHEHGGVDVVVLDNGHIVVTSFVKVSMHQPDLCRSLRDASTLQRSDLDALVQRNTRHAT